MPNVKTLRCATVQLSHLTRRQFLVASVGTCSLAFGMPVPNLRGRLGNRMLRIGTMTDVRSPELQRGLAFGVDEARHSARLIGWQIEMSDLAGRVTEVDAVILAAAVPSPRGDVPVLRLTCGPSVPASNEVTLYPRAATIARALEASLESADLLAGDVLLVTDEGQRWLGRSLAAAAGPGMLADARCLSDGASTHDTVPIRRVQLWHPSLDRFGAEQLRARYRARTSAEMTSDAWLGWFSVKVLWEAAARAKTTAPSDLMAYLRSPAARFDGHKGLPLRFNADSELEQPLYVVQRSPGSPDWRLVAEMPPATVRLSR